MRTMSLLGVVFFVFFSISAFSEGIPVEYDIPSAKADLARAASLLAKAKSKYLAQKDRKDRMEPFYLASVAAHNQAQANLREARKKQSEQYPEVSDAAKSVSELRKKIAENEKAVLEIEPQFEIAKKPYAEAEGAIAKWNQQIAGLESQIAQLKRKPAAERGTLPALEKSREQAAKEKAGWEAVKLRHSPEYSKAYHLIQEKTQENASLQARVQTLDSARNGKLQLYEQQTARVNQLSVQATRAADQLARVEFLKEDETNALEPLKADFDYWEQIAKNAESHYAGVVARVEKARTRLTEVAREKGSADGAEEAKLRAQSLGSEQGKATANQLGKRAGTKDARSREISAGYEAAKKRPNGVESDAWHQEGIEAGKRLAIAKAMREDFPAAYNEALRSLISEAPAKQIELDIEKNDVVPEDQELPLEALSDNLYSVDSQPDIAPFKPVLAPIGIPVNPQPTPEIPKPDLSHAQPPCEKVILPEFQGLCESTYREAYEAAFQKLYAETFRKTFDASFGATVGGVYENASKQEYLGLRKMSLEAGIKDIASAKGFLEVYPKARLEQVAAGKKHLAYLLSKSYLVVARYGTLVAPEILTHAIPGQKASLSVVFDNYGKKEVPAGHLRLLLKKSRAFSISREGLRTLPALPPETRTVVKNVATGLIGHEVPGASARVELRVDRKQLGGGFIPMKDIAVECPRRAPLEISAWKFANPPKVKGETDLTLTFQNNTTEIRPPTRVKLDTAPRSMTFEPSVVTLRELAPGESVEVTVQAKVTVWAGGNQYVSVRYAEVSEDGKELKRSGTAIYPQFFISKLKIDRVASLAILNQEEKETPSGYFQIRKGEKLKFRARIQYHASVAYTGPFTVVAGATSDPGIKLIAGSSGGLTFPALGPGYPSSDVEYTYEVPGNLKNEGWVTINLFHGNATIHQTQIFVERIEE